jgi:hypothetical protein
LNLQDRLLTLVGVLIPWAHRPFEVCRWQNGCNDTEIILARGLAIQSNTLNSFALTPKRKEPTGTAVSVNDQGPVISDLQEAKRPVKKVYRAGESTILLDSRQRSCDLRIEKKDGEEETPACKLLYLDTKRQILAVSM